MVTETLHVGGMMCAACVRAVERAAQKINGVDVATVNLATETLRITYDGSPNTLAAVKQAIIDQDFEIIEPNTPKVKTPQPWLTDKRKLLLCVILSIILLTISMGPMLGLRLPTCIDPDQNVRLYGFIQLCCALIVMLLNLRVYRTGFKTLWHHVPGMDSLIAVGTTASFFYSLYGLILGDRSFFFFESCATILTFVLLGKFMEARARRRTNQAVKKLQDLAPKSAVILTNGKQLEVPLETILPDDLVLVKPGERIPVDGIIIEGHTRVDESMLTGESVLVDKHEGDNIIGASQNIDGSITIRVKRTGADTVLSQIIRMVQEAQGSKAPIARLADKAAGVFVPVVMSIAVLSALIWLLCGSTFGFALRVFVTVLVIACPCALGLATPTAVMVGTGTAAEYGLLFKDGETLERMSSLRRVIFDKTGTITKGKPSVTAVESLDNKENELLQFAAAVEQYSEHSLGKAILMEAQQRNLPLLPAIEFSTESGRGVHATVNGFPVVIGNERQMQAEKISTDTLTERIQVQSALGRTVVLIAVNNQLRGFIALSDVIRPNSAAAIKALTERGIESVMLTGDQALTAERIAAEAGITHVIAGVLPDDKATAVNALKKDGKSTAMVGDGINDAPALAASDIGIAVASGTDIAIEAADLVLMKNDLLDVVRGMTISEITIRNIKQNLFWAFAFNSLGIPIAAGVLYPFGGPLLNPMFAAAAMSCSSVIVVSNALRIKNLIAKRLK